MHNICSMTKLPTSAYKEKNGCHRGGWGGEGRMETEDIVHGNVHW